MTDVKATLERHTKCRKLLKRTEGMRDNTYENHC